MSFSFSTPSESTRFFPVDHDFVCGGSVLFTMDSILLPGVEDRQKSLKLSGNFGFFMD